MGNGNTIRNVDHTIFHCSAARMLWSALWKEFGLSCVIPRRCKDVFCEIPFCFKKNKMAAMMCNCAVMFVCGCCGWKETEESSKEESK